jgi:hypothetical protein
MLEIRPSVLRDLTLHKHPPQLVADPSRWVPPEQLFLFRDRLEQAVDLNYRNTSLTDGDCSQTQVMLLLTLAK